jgi:dTDP-4-amino-4,6-dideoxygalactose transaminase
MAPTRAARDAAVSALRRRGVAASVLYPGTIDEIPDLRPHLAGVPNHLPGAREIAARLLTLPVYPTLSEDEVSLVGDAFEAIAAVVER